MIRSLALVGLLAASLAALWNLDPPRVILSGDDVVGELAPVRSVSPMKTLGPACLTTMSVAAGSQAMAVYTPCSGVSR